MLSGSWRVNLQPTAEPELANAHSRDTVVLRNVIVAFCTSLVTVWEEGDSVGRSEVRGTVWEVKGEGDNVGRSEVRSEVETDRQSLAVLGDR